LAELNKEYGSLAETIAEIKATAETEAKKEAEQIITNAKHVAENLQNEIKRIAETELALARNELRKQIVSEVEASVAKKIKTDFTPEMAKSFVSKQASRLDALN
jgi:F0F1-type ATP synthase membrane subunit b/b'